MGQKQVTILAPATDGVLQYLFFFCLDAKETKNQGKRNAPLLCHANAQELRYFDDCLLVL